MSQPNLGHQEREQAEALYERAKASQTQFWKDLHQLEVLLGIEVDGTIDLAESSLDQLFPKGLKMKRYVPLTISSAPGGTR